MNTFTELIEIVRFPSPKGDFEIVWRIVASDDGHRFLDVCRMKNTSRISGVIMRLEDMPIAREAIDAIDDAIKETTSV